MLKTSKRLQIVIIIACEPIQLCGAHWHIVIMITLHIKFVLILIIISAVL